MKTLVKCGNSRKPVKVIEKSGTLFSIAIGDTIYHLDIVKVREGVYSILHNGRSLSLDISTGNTVGAYKVTDDRACYDILLQHGFTDMGSGYRKINAHQQVKAPMPGKIVKVKVNPGDEVTPGTPLVTLSAMKMENDITSIVTGIVERIDVKEEELVREGQVLVDIKAHAC